MPTTQMGIPVSVPVDAVEREKSLGGALEMKVRVLVDALQGRAA